MPDCVLTNPLANGECGRISDLNLGTPTAVTNFDSDAVRGFGVRPHTWQVSLNLEHELTDGLAVDVGYFRTSTSNFFVTENIALATADFDPYCVTVPTDSRIPGGGGNQLCSGTL